MFTNRLRLVLTLSAIFVTVPWIANAGVVTLSFDNWNVNWLNDNVNMFDPYQGHINCGPIIDIWCVDCRHNVNDTQWTVNATSISAGSGSFGNTYLGDKTDYLAIVWLIEKYQELPSDPGDPSIPAFEQLEYQYAIWAFSGWDTLDQSPMHDQAYGLHDAALAAAKGYKPTGWTILTDTGGSNQEFIVEEQVPEPSLMVLMLIGVSAVCVYCYRTGRS